MMLFGAAMSAAAMAAMLHILAHASFKAALFMVAGIVDHETHTRDIRRFGGACYMHTGSQKSYDRQMGVFANEYLRMKAPEELVRFMRHDFSELQAHCGHVMGLRIAIPRLIPMEKIA